MLSTIDNVIASAIWFITSVTCVIHFAALFTDARGILKRNYKAWRKPQYSLFQQCTRSCFGPFLVALLFNYSGMDKTFLAIVAIQVFSVFLLASASLLKEK